MGFRRKVDHDIRLFCLKNVIHGFAIRDIRLDEANLVDDLVQSFHISGIGQLVQDNDAVGGVFFYHIMHKIAADKPGAARNQ